MSDFDGREDSQPVPWRERGACYGISQVDPTIFFPGADQGDQRKKVNQRQYDRARAVCAECTVTDECLEVALKLPIPALTGTIWAGRTEKQIRKIRKERGLVRSNAAKCGTRSGYNKHLAGGEEPCDPCREANMREKTESRRRQGSATGTAMAGQAGSVATHKQWHVNKGRRVAHCVWCRRTVA